MLLNGITWREVEADAGAGIAKHGCPHTRRELVEVLMRQGEPDTETSGLGECIGQVGRQA